MDDLGDDVQFPGAETPQRQYHLDLSGVSIAVHEWGSPSAPPLFFMHGGFDFARTYDAFAPRFARAGFRVIAWDQRGHGDSGHAHLYSWDGDLRDAIGVMASVTDQPAPVLGHSKGGALMIQLAEAHPFRFSHLINLDGLPSKRPMNDVPEHERSRMVASEVGGWLDHRRTTATAARKPGTLEELAHRRAKQNPRLPIEWLRYLVTVGARHDADGWRWKLDPSMRHGGFGPWRPEWTAQRLPALGMPFLGVLGGQMEPMGWGTLPGDIEPLLPKYGRLEVLPDTGHFVHIEQGELVANLALEFLERHS
jgi:pimeloyl-ACP methyl ester carboxylesterase